MNNLLNLAKNEALPSSPLTEIDATIRPSTEWLSHFPRDFSEEMAPREEYWNAYVGHRTSILVIEKIMTILAINEIIVSRSPYNSMWVVVGKSADIRNIIVAYNLKEIHEKLEIAYLFDVNFENNRALPRLNSILYDPENHNSIIPKKFVRNALRDHAHALEARALERSAWEMAAQRRHARNAARRRTFERQHPARTAADLFDRRRLWDDDFVVEEAGEDWPARSPDDWDRIAAVAEPDPGERWVEGALRNHGHPMLLSSQGIGWQPSAKARTDSVPLRTPKMRFSSHQ